MINLILISEMLNGDVNQIYKKHFVKAVFIEMITFVLKYKNILFLLSMR